VAPDIANHTQSIGKKYADIIPEARRMRESGKTYKQIGDHFGVSKHTASRMLNLEHHADCVAKRRNDHKHRYGSDPEYRRKIIRRVCDQQKTVRGRVLARLRLSRIEAKRNGFAACSASADTILEAFTGKCQLCGITEDELGKKLVIDHCHQTGRFRGWICSFCNSGLGYFRDSEIILQKAIGYLNDSRRQHE